MKRLYLLFAAAYLLEGVTEIAFILNIYLKKLDFQPVQIGQILFLGGLWFVFLKPVIGFLADFWKKFNARLVLVLSLGCSTAGWLLISQVQSQLALTLGVSLKVIAVAALDVLIDGMIVKVSTAKNRTFIQSLVYCCRFGGAMLCSIWAGLKIDQGVVAFVQIFYLFSLLPLAVLFPVLWYKNEDLENLQQDTPEPVAAPASPGFREKIAQLANPAFGWLLMLMLLFALGADTSTYFDPILEERFSGAFLGMITNLYYWGILAGILLFPMLRLRAGIKTLFIVSLVGWAAAELSCLWITTWNGGIIYFFGGLFNAFTSIALLTVAAAMCKIRGIETFAFAFATSVKNLMDQSNVLIGGYLMQAVGLEWLFVISSLCGFLPFLVIGKIDFRDV